MTAIKTGAAIAAAVVSVVVLLAGTVQVCLCDPDPDNCGQECHVCVDRADATMDSICVVRGESAGPVHDRGSEDDHVLHAEDHACDHELVSLGDLFSVQTAVSVPLVENSPAVFSIVRTMSSLPREWRPHSTAPPDSGGCYLHYATRVHPLA